MCNYNPDLVWFNKISNRVICDENVEVVFVETLNKSSKKHRKINTHEASFQYIAAIEIVQ